MLFLTGTTQNYSIFYQQVVPNRNEEINSDNIRVWFSSLMGAELVFY